VIRNQLPVTIDIEMACWSIPKPTFYVMNIPPGRLRLLPLILFAPKLLEESASILKELEFENSVVTLLGDDWKR
jgi:hypothetical protein